MDVELEPEQSPEVAAVVADLVAPALPEPAAWWRSGIAESLET